MKTRPGLFEGSQKVQMAEVSLATVGKTTVYLFALFGELLFRFQPSWSCCWAFRASSQRAGGGHCGSALVLPDMRSPASPYGQSWLSLLAERFPSWRKIFFPLSFILWNQIYSKPLQEVCLCWEGTGQIKAPEFGRRRHVMLMAPLASH